jgi:hypothetical protein
LAVARARVNAAVLANLDIGSAQMQCSGTEMFDPLRGLPTLPAALAVQEPDNFFVQFHSNPNKQDTLELRAVGLSLEHYFQGLTYVEHMDPQVLNRVRADARVRAVLAIPVACKLSLRDIQLATGAQQSSRPPYSLGVRLFEKNKPEIADRLRAAGFAPTSFMLSEGAAVVVVVKYADLLRLAAVAGVQWIEQPTPISVDYPRFNTLPTRWMDSHGGERVRNSRRTLPAA